VIRVDHTVIGPPYRVKRERRTSGSAHRCRLSTQIARRLPLAFRPARLEEAGEPQAIDVSANACFSHTVLRNAPAAERRRAMAFSSVSQCLRGVISDWCAIRGHSPFEATHGASRPDCPAALKGGQRLSNDVGLIHKGGPIAAGRLATENPTTRHSQMVSSFSGLRPLRCLLTFYLTRASPWNRIGCDPMRDLSEQTSRLQIPHHGGDRTEIGPIAYTLQVVKYALIARWRRRIRAEGADNHGSTRSIDR